jgi:hypothetical protein
VPHSEHPPAGYGAAYVLPVEGLAVCYPAPLHLPVRWATWAWWRLRGRPSRSERAALEARINLWHGRAERYARECELLRMVNSRAIHEREDAEARVAELERVLEVLRQELLGWHVE